MIATTTTLGHPFAGNPQIPARKVGIPPTHPPRQPSRSLAFLVSLVILAVGFGGPISSAKAQYPEDPVLHLPFSETTGSQTADASGNGHVTTVNNGGIWVSGKVGNALELDGVNDYASTQAAGDLRITGDLTFSLWIKPHAYPRGWTGILSKRESDTVSELNFRIKNSTTAQLYYGNGSNACVLTWNPSAYLPLNTWTQVTGVRDLTAGTLTLYFNGYAGPTRSTCGVAFPSWSSLLIGKQANLAKTFDGVLDEIKIFDRAMTPAEVAWRYTRDSGATNLLANPGFESGTTNPPFPSVVRGIFEIDRSFSAVGRSSLKHTATSNNSYSSPYTGQDSVVSRATAGQTFQLSAMATAAGDTPIQARIFCLDAAYGILTTGVGNFTATSTWQRFGTSHTCPSGTEYVSIRLDNDGGAGAIVWWDDLYLVHAINDAELVGQNVPSSLIAGETATVTVTMRNTGTTLWTPGQSYRLGSQNPQGNTTWGLTRVDLAAGDVVAPGQTHNFVFTITAPATAGPYDFQWRMVEELVQWFGPSTTNLQIDVVGPPPVDVTPPTQENLTITDRLWEIDGTKTYTITLVASDAESGVQRMDAAINYQGANSANPRGAFAWHASASVHLADSFPCTGGGFASKAANQLNSETVTLVGCSTVLNGAQRAVTLTVRPELTFGDLDDIDISMSAEDAATNLSPWTNYNLSFRSVVDGSQGSQGCGLVLDDVGGRYFDGPQATPTYMAGSHTWDNLQDRGDTADFGYTAYLDMMQAKKHNFMRMWSWQNADIADAGDTAYGMNINPLPWLKVGGCYDLYDGTLDLSDPSSFDPSKVRFDEAYFQRLAQRVGEACGRGIYVDVMLFQGFSAKICNHPPCDYFPWPRHPFSLANNCEGIDGNLGSVSTTDGRKFHEVNLANATDPMEILVGKFQKAYVDKVIDTLDGYSNVVYEIANEDVGSSANIDWEYALISYARSQSGRPVGMTSFGFSGSNQVLRNSGADWISPAVKTGEDYAYDPPVGTGAQVILSDNDHLKCILETPNFSQDCPNVGDNDPDDNDGEWLVRANYRQWIWKSFMRGLNVLLMDAVEHPPGANDPGSYPAVNPNNPAFRYARDYLGHTRHYSTRIDLALAAPEPGLCSTGYCLAEAGSQYLVYQPSQGSFTVYLEPGVYALEWFNPHGLQSPPAKTDPLALGLVDDVHVITGQTITVSTAGNRTFGSGMYPRPSGFGCEDDGVAYECDVVLLLTVQPTEPPPAPPTGVMASDGTFPDKVRVVWNPVAGATHYEVWRATSNLTSEASRIAAVVAGSPYDDTSALPFEDGYYYWVKAVNLAGASDFSSSDHGSLDLAPEIAVIQGWNGVEVADGDVVALPPLVEGSQATHRLTIENRGQGPLAIDNPATLLASHPCIVQVAAVAASVPYGGSTALDIHVDCAAGLHQVALSIQNDDPNEDPFDLTLQLTVSQAPTCIEDAYHLCLQNGRFRVEATFRTPENGPTYAAQAVPYEGSEQSGFFWFFGPGNLEVVIKILDATTLTNSFWIFHGGTTDREYTLHVEDVSTGAVWETTRPHGSLCGGFNFDAFPQDPGANLGDEPWAPEKGLPNGVQGFALDLAGLTGPEGPADPGKSGSCVPSDTVLCLQDGRFAVEVDWVDHANQAGQGHAIPRTVQTGLFWFFGPGNLELMVKVLDARDPWGHWWVFYGSLTDVQFNLQVTDTVLGNIATFVNPSGTYCGGADFESLPDP